MTRQFPAFLYEVGEDVLVRLDEALVYEVGNSVLVVTRLPSWTIANITARDASGNQPRYRVEFPLRERTHTCTVDESAIEGTA